MTIYEFDRYINGQLMAEGVTIEKAKTLEAATTAAVRIASKGPKGEAPVLVLRREREPVEPVAWLPTSTVKWLSEYDGPACATTTAAHNRPIKSDGGVPVYTTPPDALALVAAAYRDAAEAFTRPEAKHAIAEHIAKRTPADAQAALTAIERAAYERGVMDAAEKSDFYANADYCAMGYPEDGGIAASGTARMIHRDILALLTQEGR